MDRDRNQDIQLRHFVSALSRLTARLRDYAAYYISADFGKRSSVIQKNICFLYNVSILLNNMDKIDKCFQIFSFGILKM